MNARGWTILVMIVVLAGAAVLYWTRGGTPQPPAGAAQNIEAHFACDGGKSIDATFVNVTQSTTTGNSVRLILSDGREMTLPQAISADGARYANAGESIVFWNVGNGATFTENGTSTYQNCATGR